MRPYGPRFHSTVNNRGYCQFKSPPIRLRWVEAFTKAQSFPARQPLRRGRNPITELRVQNQASIRIRLPDLRSFGFVL